MTMKASRVNLVICILYLWIAISCFIFDHNWNRVGTQQSNNVASLSSGEVRLYFLEIDLRSQIKPLETLLFCLFYICYTRSLLPLKSRIRVYLLLVDRDPTTTTHKIKIRLDHEIKIGLKYLANLIRRLTLRSWDWISIIMLFRVSISWSFLQLTKQSLDQN